MNHTLELPQLQGTTVLTKQEILETRELAFEVANSLSVRKLLTHMGILNSMAWRAAIDYGAIYKDDIGVYRIIPEKWENLLACSAAGEVQITVSIEWTEDYLKQCWPTAFYNDVTLRAYRAKHLELGLFYYDTENRPKGAAWGHKHGVPCQGVATPPKLERFDIARTLIFYQVFDQVRRDKVAKKDKSDDAAFNSMPKHGGMVMVELYNALFFGIAEFHGASFGSRDIVIGVVDPLPATNTFIWKWKYKNTLSKNWSQHLYPQVWRDMVDRVGQKAERAIEIITNLIREPMGDMAEVPF
jgi:hypothetical protein